MTLHQTPGDTFIPGSFPGILKEGRSVISFSFRYDLNEGDNFLIFYVPL